MDFAGKKLNFVQIGLGTNCTFVHNLAGSKEEYNRNIAWMFQPTSEHDPEKVLGIAVEPVLDCIDALRPIAAKLPGVHLLQAAMGEHNESGAEMTGLSDAMRADLVSQVPPAKRQKLTEDLEYLRNMSCLGYMHPLMPMCKQSIEHNFDLKLEIGCNAKIDVWSWEKLVKNFNFVGCELVLVDAEGCDTKILRGLLSYCREHPEHWPEMISFETMGHCDRQEGLGAEKAVLDAFTDEGYEIICISDYNCHVIKSSALEKERRLKKWTYKWHCYICFGQWCMPYVSNKSGIFCEECHDKLIAEGGSMPLRIGRKLDDLSRSSPIWDQPEDEDWWNTGFHHRVREWKPWENNGDEAEFNIEDEVKKYAGDMWKKDDAKVADEETIADAEKTT